MHLLHLIPRYYPAKGGAENHIREISVRLVAAGHQVTVATTDALDVELFWQAGHRRVSESESLVDGVRILRFPVRHLLPTPWAYPAMRRSLWLFSLIPFVPIWAACQLARFTPWVPDLWHWLRQTQDPFDLVAGMSICFEPLLEAGLGFARRRNIPSIIYPLVHLGAGSAPGQDALGRFYTMRHQNALVKQADAIIAQTETEKKFYQDQGFPAERIWPIGPGVNPSEFQSGNAVSFRERHGLNGPVIISISQMTYDKGTVHTVEAVRQLWQAGRQVELVLAGSVLGPFRHYLGQLPLEDRDKIHLLGFISDEERRDLLTAADMLVMPSRTDSFGVAYLEAWLYNKPVIGAQAWGISDIITDGQDGLLVPFGDVPALAQSITYLLDHPQEAMIMGQRGAEKVRRLHTWDQKIETIQQIYTALIFKKKG